MLCLVLFCCAHLGRRDVQIVTPEIDMQNANCTFGHNLLQYYLALVWDGITWGWVRAALRDIVFISIGFDF